MDQDSWNRDASEGTGCQQPDGPLLCSNNCGFLACSATMNLCSKCYRELLLKQQGSHHMEKAKVAENLVASSFSAADDAQVRTDLGRTTLSSSLLAPPAAEHASARSLNDERKGAGSLSDERKDFSSVNSASGLPSLQIPSQPKGTPSASLAGPVQASHLGPQQTARKHTGNRCLTCHKRVGLLGFKCRCGDLFCATHRYSDMHNCSFDYKSAGREAIAKANPVVKAEKVMKI